MEVKEPILALTNALENSKKVCDNRDVTSTAGNARITDITTTCTSEQLKKNMGESRLIKAPETRTFVSATETAKACDLELCTKETFPSEAHHLIPHEYLPTHSVCGWLVKPGGAKELPYTPHPDYELENHTNYDTDHWRNGMCLPHAADTAQWKEAGINSEKKKEIAFRIMKLTTLQLHQGKHSFTSYVSDTAGYKTEVGRLLNQVDEAALAHAKTCRICDKNGKNKLRPRDEVVEHMHGVSDILRAQIIANKVFVSRRAANFHLEKVAGKEPGNKPCP